jgi:EmrB/QacA subfamily drug resistance transporter
MLSTDAPSDPARNRSWALLVLLCAAQFMVVLDVTVVNVALPSIGRSLGFAEADLQWVVTAYVLFSGGLLLLGGRCADLLGRRRVLVTGLLLFTAASLASGLAVSPAALVTARAAQGLGAALLTPAALSTITAGYEGARRAAALAVWGAIGSAGAAAGVLLGGVLTTWLGWQWVFFVNVPVGVIATAMTLRLVPAVAAARGALGRLDVPGAAALVSGLVVLVYALEGVAEHGWGAARTLVLLLIAAALLAAFAALERAAARPLVPAATWRMRPLVVSAAMMLAATGVLVGAFFLNSLYLQRALHASALETGLAFLPIAVAIALAAHAASHLLRRAGSRLVAAGGLALMGGGALMLALVPDRASYVSDLLPGFLVLGAGVGLTFVAVSVTAMSDVRHDQAGVASGLMATAHEVGAAFGVALLSAVASAAGPNLVDGYRAGFVAAASLALVLAAGALATMPSVRPAASARAAIH